MSSPEATWHLHLLGRAELIAPDGTSVRLPTQKVLTLLAVVALAKGEISRSQAASAVWQDSEPKAARDSLRTALASIRKVLSQSAITATADTISLNLAAVHCDALDPNSPYEDFMPGIENDWVIDERLSRRETQVVTLLTEARLKWDGGKQSDAIALVDRACEIDPLHEGAAQTRVQFLDASGLRSRAAEFSDAFRARVFRDLGVVSNLRPAAQAPVAHPLVAAAEWLLVRDPAQAGAMLASTHSQWLTLPVEQSLALHERTLRYWDEQSAARRVVEAQTMSLLVLAGRLGPYVDQALALYDRAIEAGEPLAAARLAGALSYGFLSRGEFARSLSFARLSQDAASRLVDKSLRVDFEVQLGIVLQQIGEKDAAKAIVRKCARAAEESGEMVQIASTRLGLSDDMMQSGKPDVAAKALEIARRQFGSAGVSRMYAWVLHSEAQLYCSVGEFERARTNLQEIKSIGPDIGGHAVTAMTEDWLARVDCALGEYVMAAEALARAKLSRTKAGAVPSIYERANVLTTKRKLKDRLRPEEIQAAFRRVATAASA